MQHLDEGTVHAWLDGALAPDEARAVEAHAAGCPACSDLVAEARGLIAASSRILTALDEVPAGVLPGGGRDTGDDLAALRERTAMARLAQRRRWRRTPFLAAAAVAFVAVGTVVVMQRTPTPMPVSIDSASRASPIGRDSLTVLRDAGRAGSADTPQRAAGQEAGRTSAGAREADKASASVPGRARESQNEPRVAAAPREEFARQSQARLSQQQQQRQTIPEVTPPPQKAFSVASRAIDSARAIDSSRLRKEVVTAIVQAPVTAAGVAPPRAADTIQPPRNPAPRQLGDVRLSEVVVTGAASVPSRRDQATRALTGGLSASLFAGCYQIPIDPRAVNPRFGIALPERVALDTVPLLVGDSTWYRARALDSGRAWAGVQLAWYPLPVGIAGDPLAAIIRVARDREILKTAVRLPALALDLTSQTLSSQLRERPATAPGATRITCPR